MLDSSVGKTPSVRFQDHTDPWTVCQLRNLLHLENGYAFKSKFFSDNPTKTIVLTPGNVRIGGGFQDGKGQFYEGEDGIEQYQFEAGDIFVTMTDLTPTSQALGYPARVPDDGVTYLHNQRLGKLTDFDGDYDFLLNLLSTEAYHRFIVSTASGTTVKHTSPTKILSFESHFPAPSEQAKIGSYFKSLDRLISLHQQKHGKLVTLKQAMLQKMFPRDGAATPEIRFKGFEGEWELKELNVLAEFNPITTLPRVFEYVDLESVVGTELISHRTETWNSAPSRAQRVARKGDLFFQTVRPYQKNNHLFTLLRDDFVFSTGYAQIRPLHDGNFLLATVQRDEFLKEVLDNCTGTSYPAITATTLSKIAIKVPSPTEQQKLGSYFHNLDNLISKHAIQIEKLKNIKSACLEKMFV